MNNTKEMNNKFSTEFMHVSTTNSKLGAQIPCVNLPAIITCRPDAPCAKDGCYALKGNWRFTGVQASLKKNLDAYLSDSEKYFHEIQIKTALSTYCRWHSSGDMVDINYLEGMCKVARKNKNTKYLCFTKKFEVVNLYVGSGKKIPSNLKIVFSAWKEFIPYNPYNFPMTYLKDKNTPQGAIPETAIPCSGHCPECLACWGLKKGQAVYFKKH